MRLSVARGKRQSQVDSAVTGAQLDIQLLVTFIPPAPAPGSPLKKQKHNMENLQILIQTDKNIENSAGLEEHVRNSVNKAMAHFDERLTRVEVHLRDVNGDKYGDRDHECMMEARLRGLKPLAVTHADSNLHLAIAGASERLRNAVSNLVGRMEAK